MQAKATGLCNVCYNKYCMIALTYRCSAGSSGLFHGLECTHFCKERNEAGNLEECIYTTIDNAWQCEDSMSELRVAVTQSGLVSYPSPGFYFTPPPPFSCMYVLFSCFPVCICPTYVYVTSQVSLTRLPHDFLHVQQQEDVCGPTDVWTWEPHYQGRVSLMLASILNLLPLNDFATSLAST